MNFCTKLFGVKVLHNVFKLYICKYLNVCALFFIFGQEASENASANLVWFQWRKTHNKVEILAKCDSLFLHHG